MRERLRLDTWQPAHSAVGGQEQTRSCGWVLAPIDAPIPGGHSRSIETPPASTPAPGRVAAPAIRVLLPILIGKRRLKSAAMQIQLDDIGGGERLLGQVGEEEFVHNARARNPNGTFLLGGWMGGYDHAARHAFGPHRDLRAVVEAAHRLANFPLLGLIGRQMQTCLHEWMIEYAVLFAARHKGEPGQVSEHSPSAVLSIKPEQGALRQKLVCGKVARNRREALTQFLPIAAVTPIAKRAEPLKTVGLTDDGPRPHHLPTLAPPVARGADVIQP
jgi:hypothetical protein